MLSRAFRDVLFLQDWCLRLEASVAKILAVFSISVLMNLLAICSLNVLSLLMFEK